MKRVAILGSTGSIGTQTLDILRAHPDRFQVVGLAAAQNAERLHQQAQEFGVKNLALFHPETAHQHHLPGGVEGLTQIATLPEADIVVVSVAGVIGLVPTIEAIKAKKDIALASKEVLVAGGEVVMPLVQEHGVTMTPIDSEHSALFQCLLGTPKEHVQNLILTASGGPFRGKTRANLQNITVEQALNHPTWRMGGKITIDSATLMNKALEMIEARWLFDVPIERVEALIHPQSIIHSFVRTRDGSVLGQLGWPNMKLPILYALSYPDRVPNDLPVWNPVDTPNLTFEPIDHETFTGLNLAREAMRQGGTMPCIFNAANEVAANAFLAGNCGFLAITEIVEHVMSLGRPTEATLESLLAADAWARAEADARLTLL